VGWEEEEKAGEGREGRTEEGGKGREGRKGYEGLAPSAKILFMPLYRQARLVS